MYCKARNFDLSPSTTAQCRSPEAVGHASRILTSQFAFASHPSPPSKTVSKASKHWSVPSNGEVVAVDVGVVVPVVVVVVVLEVVELTVVEVSVVEV